MQKRDHILAHTPTRKFNTHTHTHKHTHTNILTHAKSKHSEAQSHTCTPFWVPRRRNTLSKRHRVKKKKKENHAQIEIETNKFFEL